MFKGKMKPIIPQKISKITRDKILKDNPNIGTLGRFYDGVALFEKRDYSAGWIGIDGKILGEGHYSCEHFSNGIAKYKFGSNIGYIDSTGKTLGFSFNLSDKWSIFIDSFNNGTGRYALDFDTKGFAIFKDSNEQLGIVNNKGDVLIHGCYECQNFEKEIRGFAKFVKDGKTGFINIYGEVLFEKEIGGIQYLQNNGKSFLRSVLLKNNK